MKKLVVLILTGVILAFSSVTFATSLTLGHIQITNNTNGVIFYSIDTRDGKVISRNPGGSIFSGNKSVTVDLEGTNNMKAYVTVLDSKGLYVFSTTLVGFGNGQPVHAVSQGNDSKYRATQQYSEHGDIITLSDAK